jgi:predicted metal-binding membrane protein
MSIAATVYFCRTMCCEKEMIGGWTMSMMWTRMPGQSWLGSAVSFLLMWLAMMVAMMLPSAVPMFLRARHTTASFLSIMAGYFGVWLAVGVGVYLMGVLFAAMAMHSERFSRFVPLLSAAALIGAGLFQFSRWKVKGLNECRSRFGCAGGCPERAAGFALGCKQGATCCLCCTGPMVLMIVLGMMNPLVMIGVALVVAAEKLLPRPETIARLVGISAIIAGFVSLWSPYLTRG